MFSVKTDENHVAGIDPMKLAHYRFNEILVSTSC